MNVRLGPWLTITSITRLRTIEVDGELYALTVRNDGSGGWTIGIGRGPRGAWAYVPGVVNYREAERSATRWARRMLPGLVSA